MALTSKGEHDELRSRLPILPPAARQRRIEVTIRSFIAWDFMQPWGLTGIAFQKDDKSEFTVWTPGEFKRDVWVWRGPRHIPTERAQRLSMWLTQEENSVDLTAAPITEAHDDISGQTIWIWDPDPNLEGGLVITRLGDVGFGLELMMAGLYRGSARIEGEEGELLARWLIAN